jgi:hypothetical protein
MLVQTPQCSTMPVTGTVARLPVHRALDFKGHKSYVSRAASLVRVHMHPETLCSCTKAAVSRGTSGAVGGSTTDTKALDVAGCHFVRQQPKKTINMGPNIPDSLNNMKDDQVAIKKWHACANCSNCAKVSFIILCKSWYGARTFAHSTSHDTGIHPPIRSCSQCRTDASPASDVL